MRVIKKGKKPTSTFKGTCTNCNSVMEEDRRKLKMEHCPKEHYEFAHGTCPVCKNSFVLYPSRKR